MSYIDLREALEGTNQNTSFDAFAFLANLSKFTSLSPDEDQLQLARELLIRVLQSST